MKLILFIIFSCLNVNAAVLSSIPNIPNRVAFTPTVIGTTTAGTGTYSTQVGYYSIKNDEVTVYINIQISAHTGAGNIRLSALPFTSSSTSSLIGSCYIGFVNNLSLTASNYLTAYVITGSTSIDLAQVPTGGGGSGGVPMDTAFQIVLNCTYPI